MFQSSEDKDIDEIFLNYDFDIPNTTNDSNKRNLDEICNQPIKKKCTGSPDNKTLNILSIIQSKTSQTRIDKPKTNCFINKSTTDINNSKSISSVTPERCRKIVQRKFPGPAGILPEKRELGINIKTLEEFESSANNKTLESDEILCSQLSEDIFKKGPWLKMLADWSPTNSNKKLPEKYTVSWLKSKAIAKKLIGQKTPFLASIIQTIDSSNKDPMILLKDKTGEIQATLLHEAWEEYDEFLLPGSVIILKQTSVLSTLKKQYLSITLNNIVSIYYEHDKQKVEIIENQPITVDEIIKTIEKTKQNHETQKILQKIQPVDNNPYMKTVNNKNETTNKFNFTKISVNINKNCGNSGKKVEANSPSSSSRNDERSNEENVVLSQVLEGLDTNLLFDDF